MSFQISEFRISRVLEDTTPNMSKKTNPLLAGVPNSVKIFIKQNLYFVPSNQERDRCDQIDKIFSAGRICFPNCANYTPLVIEGLEKLYGENWKDFYVNFNGFEPRMGLKLQASEA